MKSLILPVPPTEDLSGRAINKLPASLQQNEHIISSIQERVAEYNSKLAATLKQENPFKEWGIKLATAEQRFKESGSSLADLKIAYKEFIKFANFAKFPANAKYWEENLAKIEKLQKRKNKTKFKVRKKIKSDNETKLLHGQLLNQWRKNFNQESEKWEWSKIQQFKSLFLQELEDWIEHLRKIANLIDELGLEPGYLLDFSKGNIKLSDISILKEWLDVVERDKGIKELCRILGRMRQIGHSTEIKQTKTTRLVSKYIQDSNSKEEIIGIKIGNEIEHVVPSELSLLSSDDTCILFDLKFIESQLMCFDMAGQQFVDEEIETYKDQEVEVQETKGPIILCVDTSGSMHGSPEIVAKAITLHMVNLARKDKRDCYLINFSTQIDTLDFSSGIGFETLLSFLQKSFHGGTDMAPALDHAIEMMKKEKYKNADIVILSDFVMPSLPKNTQSQIKRLRDKGNRFNSLCISVDFLPERLKENFDREWVYNPINSTVQEILNFCNDIFIS